MALWILNRPAELCDLTELKVAEILSLLSDDWVIRWGFYYQDNAGQSREGDFLVLGPQGGLLVLEVKAGGLSYFHRTGKWTTNDSDHPLYQLDAEWKSVLTTTNRHQGQRPPLFVSKALALPHVEIAPNISHYHDIPRDLILSLPELRQFELVWARRFNRNRILLDRRSREIFFDTFGKEAAPKAIRHFVDESDRALMRHTERNYDLLDQLAENRQFMFRGGTGSGKTWLAFEQACRWAEQGPEGSSVLFLCYNLALTDFLQELVHKAQSRHRPAKGKVTVLSWEGLAQMLFKRAGLPYEVPEAPEQRLEFYTRTLPELMAQVVAEKWSPPEYDALVVDEAQDHDTRMDSFPDNWEGPGWWGVYWKLLKEGPSSRIALFYDPAQRPVFRNLDAFDESAIYRALRANPVRVALKKTVRYSKPILRYLRSLKTPATSSLVDSLLYDAALPEGPEVEIHRAARNKIPSQVAAIVEAWIAGGYCRPEEILILSQHGRAEKSALAGCAQIAGYPVVDFLQRQRGCLNFTSANRAKGLDALGVILVDFPPFQEIGEDGLQISFFMGASRARQFLVVVNQKE